jgi:hypothetical protein
VETEINSGFKELGAKRGEQIGQDVAKDHPEWLRPPEQGEYSANPGK